MQIEVEAGMLRWMKWLCSMSELFLASSQVRRQDENALAEMFCVHVHALFLCPLFKSLEAYMLDYVTLFPHHMLDASGLGSPFVQADGHRFSANIVVPKAATWQRC